MSSTLADNIVAQGDSDTSGSGGAIFNINYGKNVDGSVTFTSVTLANSILAGTQGGDDLMSLDVDTERGVAMVTANGPNVIQTFDLANGRTITHTGNGVINPNGSDPKLDPAGLKNNGGPTPTIALTAASTAALDQGDNALVPGTTDQRGLHREVNGTVDLGAFEYQPPPTITLTTSAGSVALDQAATLTATVQQDVTGSNDLTGDVQFIVDGGAESATVPLHGLSARFGFAGLDLGAHTVEAVYQAAPAYPDAVTATLDETVTAATPTVAVTDVGGVYNGSGYAATAASVTGQDGADLTSLGDLTFSYYAGATAAGTGSATAPKDAGTYTVVAHWASNDTDYTDADSGPVTFVITPHPLDVTATGQDKVYDGTTAATVLLSDDRLAGDRFTVSATASYADPYAGTAKPLLTVAARVSTVLQQARAGREDAPPPGLRLRRQVLLQRLEIVQIRQAIAARGSFEMEHHISVQIVVQHAQQVGRQLLPTRTRQPFAAPDRSKRVVAAIALLHGRHQCPAHLVGRAHRLLDARHLRFA
jgi:hypothetical protein